MRRRRPIGDFYVTARRTRQVEGRGEVRFGDEVGRQILTFEAAAKILNDLGEPGYVQKWVASANQRVIAAERDADGNWTVTDPLTGQTRPVVV